jgi:hypothetical protein
MEALPDRLPLVIGVTGHRDLRDADLPKLEQEIAAILAGLRRDYLGNDGETPIIVLSSLAEGADRLVARVGLAHGARLVAPMPMPVDEYRRDFEPGLKPGNIAEFDALLAQAIAAPVMPFAPGNSLEAVRAGGAGRGEQYRAVGRFIAQHSNVLLALWDGDGETMSPGGTAEVVTFKRRGIPLAIAGSARASLDASEIGPVIQVITPRQRETSAADDVAVRPWGRAVIRHHRGGIIRRVLRGAAEFVAGVFGRELDDPKFHLPDDERRELESWETFAALTALTRNFNREARALGATAEGRARLARSLDDLIGRPETPAGVDRAAATERALAVAPRSCRLYAIADALAQIRQGQFQRDWLYVYTLAFVAFLCFALLALAEAASNLILVLYSLAFVGIFIVFARAHFGQHQVHFLDYRALAEALRVAVFWKLVGSDRSVADGYPIKEPGELAWVKIGLRTLELFDAPAPAIAATAPDPVGHAIARTYWVHGQYAFFRRRGLRHNRFAERLENGALVLLVLSPFLIVPIVIAFTPAPVGGHETPLRWLLLLVSGLLPGLATALNGYSDKLALKAQGRHYDRMRMLYERACELLPETLDAQTAPLVLDLYAALGAEALAENAQWVAIYRQRPIEPPK